MRPDPADAILGLPPGGLAELIEKNRLASQRAAEPQVYALLAAGWTFEVPSETATEPWQLYWRRPGPRGGRFFASTQQAYNALQRAKADA
jgi:hypothetical protein